jgi:hypothetical protein
MLPVAVYPDAEAAAIDYLTPLLATEDSSVQIGVRGAGGRFVRVRRVGGRALTPSHDLALLDVLVWHDSDRTRMALTQHLWAWLRAANNDRAGDAVLLYNATILAPRQMPDPADDTKTVCMFTVDLIVRPA